MRTIKFIMILTIAAVFLTGCATEAEEKAGKKEVTRLCNQLEHADYFTECWQLNTDDDKYTPLHKTNRKDIPKSAKRDDTEIAYDYHVAYVGDFGIKRLKTAIKCQNTDNEVHYANCWSRTGEHESQDRWFLVSMARPMEKKFLPTKTVMRAWKHGGCDSGYGHDPIGCRVKYSRKCTTFACLPIGSELPKKRKSGKKAA